MRLRRRPKPDKEPKAAKEPKPAKKPKAAKQPKPAKRRPGIAETFRVAWSPPRIRGRSAPGAGAAAGTPATAGTPVARGSKGKAGRAGALGQPVKEPDLLRQREELARQFAELQWDLGGIAYEMATRKQFKGEVILKQAEKLREVDAKLGQIERVLRLGEEGAAGTCPHCGALQARGAVFCWKCGKEVSSAAKGASEAKPSGEAGSTGGNAKPGASAPDSAAKQGTGKPDSAAKPEPK
jgi:hypothetical protein